MALSQKGAGYAHRDHIGTRDPYLQAALDSLANPIQAILTQGNFGAKGTVSPPSAPTALQISASAGIFTATIQHKNAPAGTRYRLQWSTSPNFTSPIDEELAHLTWQRSLPGQKLCFRVAAKFLASAQSAWVYAGSSAAPTLFG